MGACIVHLPTCLHTWRYMRADLVTTTMFHTEIQDCRNVTQGQSCVSGGNTSNYRPIQPHEKINPEFSVFYVSFYVFSSCVLLSVFYMFAWYINIYIYICWENNNPE